VTLRDPCAEGPAPLLDRVARHEMVGLLGAQSSLLSAALSQLRQEGRAHPAADGVIAPEELVRDALVLSRQLASVIELLAGLEGRGGTRASPLGEVLRAAVRTCAPRDAHWLCTRVSRAAGCTPVLAAPTRAVLSNVLRNAAEHRPPGAAVGLVARRHEDALLVVLQQPGACPAPVRRCLRAQGPPATGSGLGLWLVHHLTTGMGGGVTVRSRRGRGGAADAWQLRLRLPAAAA
jgi:signal transduction histidine kinase